MENHILSYSINEKIIIKQKFKLNNKNSVLVPHHLESKCRIKNDIFDFNTLVDTFYPLDMTFPENNMLATALIYDFYNIPFSLPGLSSISMSESYTTLLTNDFSYDFFDSSTNEANDYIITKECTKSNPPINEINNINMTIISDNSLHKVNKPCHKSTVKEFVKKTKKISSIIRKIKNKAKSLPSRYLNGPNQSPYKKRIVSKRIGYFNDFSFCFNEDASNK